MSARSMPTAGTRSPSSSTPSNGGQKVDQALVFHLGGDGRVTELWSLPTERAIADALTRGEPLPEHRHLPVFRTAEETRARNTFEPDDLANIGAFLREDVHWHGAGDSQWSDGARGRDQVIGLFQMFKQATGGTIHMISTGSSQTTGMRLPSSRSRPTVRTSPSGTWTSRRSTCSTSTPRAGRSSSGAFRMTPTSWTASLGPVKPTSTHRAVSGQGTSRPPVLAAAPHVRIIGALQRRR
jgi:ketosteroid isomerase-like protein